MLRQLTLSHPHPYMTIEELTTLENLNNAFYECARISHWKESTQRYKENLLIKNVELQEQLRSGTYRVSETTKFILNERGKVRYIEAPAVRDRIVQKVLCRHILIPYLSKPIIYDNYASLRDRGTTLARKRIEVLLRKYIRRHGSNGYILQVDIKKYFENVDHTVLKRMVRERINESAEIMELIEYAIDSASKTGKGLNLGSEAPQIFAIYYLSRLDNYIKTVKGVKYYGRYMDDMFIIAETKEELKELLVKIKEQLATVKLEINEKKTHITKLSHGFTFMQIKYNIDAGKIIKRPTHSKIVRERKRLKRYRKLYDAGIMTEYDIHNCYLSWRNSVRKDCNACEKSIRVMDKLYNELFPVQEEYHRQTREQIIKQAYKELATSGLTHTIPTVF